jgi:hypothetical protein
LCIKGSASTIHQHPLLIPLPQRRPRPVCARGAAEAGGRPRLERGPFCFSRRAAARCGGPPSSGLLLGPPQNQRGVSGGSQAFFDSKLRAAPGRSCGALATARCHKQVGKTCRGCCRSERCIGYLGSDGAEQRRFLSCAGSASRSESGRSKSRKRWVTRRSSATRGQLARNGRTVDVELVVIESPGRGDPRLRCSHEESRCVTDATGALEKQEPVGHCAHHDELTGLPDCLFLAGTPAECN